MSIANASDLITQSLQKTIGLNANESPSANQTSQALDILNVMLDSWNARGFLAGVPIRESFNLTANQSTYTIGASGANLTTTYPLAIQSGFIRDASNTAYDLTVITRDDYDSLTDKDLANNTGVPRMLFYDPGAIQEANQTGTIYLYPAPDSSTTYKLFLESEKGTLTFANSSDAINLPSGYKQAIVDNLSLKLCDFYGKEPTVLMITDAKESMRIIENVNSMNRVQRSGFSFPTSKLRSFNILSGTES